MSSWYIPTVDQLGEFMGMLFKIGEVEPTGGQAFREMPEFAFENGVNHMLKKHDYKIEHIGTETIEGDLGLFHTIIAILSFDD